MNKKDFNNQGYRITYILSTLLSDNHFVKADDLASQCMFHDPVFQVI